MPDPLSKIISYQYEGQAADLLDGNTPNLYVGGWDINNDTNNQNWWVVSVGGNLITVKNKSYGTYANPAAEEEGAKVIGGPNEYKWQQIGIPGGQYQIATTDGRFAWFLTGPKNRDAIVLKGTSYTGKDSQWGYRPTPPAPGK